MIDPIMKTKSNIELVKMNFSKIGDASLKALVTAEIRRRGITFSCALATPGSFKAFWHNKLIEMEGWQPA